MGTCEREKKRDKNVLHKIFYLLLTMPTFGKEVSTSF